MATPFFGLPSRSAALLGTTALALGSALIAVPAHAAPMDGHSESTGKATAVAARANLDVSVLGGINVPVKATLNQVSAPADAEETLLTAEVKGANNGRPLTLVQAEVARASAKANAQRSVGDVKLVGVRAYAPGLPGNSLLSADLLTANATCEAGEAPVATADLENVTVLGKPVDVKQLQGGGEKNIEVPSVGTVDLTLEEVTTTDSTGAAIALRLSYTVNPANLNVVKATGEIVLAEATCATPSDTGHDAPGDDTPGDDATEGQTSGGSNDSSGADGGSTGNDPVTQTGDDGTNLAETGGSSSTAVIGGVGAAVLLLGGGTLYAMRRRNAAQGS